MTASPASIRYNNPGAMWGKGNPVATKWGANQTIGLNDGLGQGNNIAVFPDMVHGAAAQFDLWRGRNYFNKPLSQAIRTWCGGNSVAQYIAFLTSRCPGLSANTLITESVLSGSLGVELMKAQAWMEAGRPYPMTDAQWQQAQSMVFKGAPAPEVPAAPGLPLVTFGSTGLHVSEMQGLLGCAETGTYMRASETEYALRLFQVRNKLKPDGECGDKTWSALKPVKTS